MFASGLVSISFRDQSPEKILFTAAGCGLKFVEWGSDVHAPCNDMVHLERLAAMQQQYGLRCCSYGTYFRLGFTPMEELEQYIRAAKALGTDHLRIWAGRKKSEDLTPEERQAFLALCAEAAQIATAHDVVLCLECHRRSYTETKEGALELMQQIDSPHFRMYWQPNPDVSTEENLAYIRSLREYITHVHVFHWAPMVRLPLHSGLHIWKQYLAALGGVHHLLLEFMPDDRIASLPQEAGALHELIRQMQ